MVLISVRTHITGADADGTLDRLPRLLSLYIHGIVRTPYLTIEPVA